MKRDPSVLVALIGETRASELTADACSATAKCVKRRVDPCSR
jgi:hypothetical protein